jgi:hypothetical protein
VSDVININRVRRRSNGDLEYRGRKLTRVERIDGWACLDYRCKTGSLSFMPGKTAVECCACGAVFHQRLVLQIADLPLRDCPHGDACPLQESHEHELYGTTLDLGRDEP